MQGLSIGRLAKLANVSIDTIRFYEKAGLLAPHERRPSGFREFSALDLKRLRFIRRGRQLGFTLEEIGELLALDRSQGPASTIVRQRLRTIDRKIEELGHWRRGLVEFLEAPARHSILECFTDDAMDAETSAHGVRATHESIKSL